MTALPRRSGWVVGAVAGALIAATLLAACSSGPVSQASFFSGQPSPAADGSASPAASPDGGSPSAPPTAPSSSGTAPPGAIAPPPRPGKPTFTLVSSTHDDTAAATTVTYRITWTAPDGVATRFLVYGLKVCLRDSATYDGKPCIVRHMAVPAGKLDLLGEAPGDVRTISVSWQVPDNGPPPYWSVLMRATNDAGNSIFTIVHSEKVCFGCYP